MKKTTSDLKAELLDIIKKTEGRAISTKPARNIPHRKNTNVLGAMTKFQRERDDKKTAAINNHNQDCRRQWPNMEASGKESMLANMQQQVKKRKLGK